MIAWDTSYLVEGKDDHSLNLVTFDPPSETWYISEVRLEFVETIYGK